MNAYRKLTALLLTCLALIFASATPSALGVPETIFPNSLTPAASGADDPYEMGTIFTPAVAGNITAVRVFSLAQESGDHVVRIWRNSDNTVIYGPVTWNYGGDNAWISLPIPGGLAVVAGTEYTVVVSVLQGAFYPFTGAFFTAPGSNGANLTYPQNAGVFSAGAGGVGLRPTTAFNQSNYFRDVIFDDGTTAPLIDVQGIGNSIVSGSTSVSVNNDTQFGAVDLVAGTVDHTFTIANPGTASLVLSGNPKVAITGAQAGDFTVVTQPASPIVAGGNTTFTVRFDPSAAGLRNATVEIANNVNTSFTFAVQGQGGITDTIFQDLVVSTNSSSDDFYELGTIFRATVPGTISKVRVFSTLEESGDHQVRIWRNDGTLVAGPITWNYGGDNAWISLDIPPVPIQADTDYTIAISTTVANGRYYPFLSQYFASSGGNGLSLTYPQAAGVFIPNQPGARPTQTFGNAAYLRDVFFTPTPTFPLMTVQGNGTDIPNGNTATSLIDDTQYGVVPIPTASDHTFTIVNNGTAPLVLSGTPRVITTGPASSEFTVTSQPSSPIAPGGSATFTVRFAPALEGVRNATVRIANNASAFYTFAVQGSSPQTTDTVFPSGAAPTISYSDQVLDGTAAFYELGTVFQATVCGTISQVRVFSTSQEAGDHQVRIWRNSDSTLVAGPITWNYGGENAWISLSIPPVTIEPGIDYTISISTTTDNDQWYPIGPHYFDNAGSNGLSLTYPAAAGVFVANSPGARPTQTFNNTSYFRDVVFTPAPLSLTVLTGQTITQSTSLTLDCLVIQDGGTFVLGAGPGPAPSSPILFPDSTVPTVIATAPPAATVNVTTPDPTPATTPTTEAQGNYGGLIEPKVASEGRPGFAAFSVNRRGSFTGSLRYEGRKYTMLGKLDRFGNFASYARTRARARLAVSVTLDLSSATARLTGTISDGGKSTSFSADRAALVSKFNPSPSAGRYVAEFLSEGTDGSGVSGEVVSGSAVVQVQPSGTARLVGKLNDGTPVSAGGLVTRAGLFPFLIAPAQRNVLPIPGVISLSEPTVRK